MNKKLALCLCILLLGGAVLFSVYAFKKDDLAAGMYEISDIHVVEVRCLAEGPGCNSTPVVLKDSEGNLQTYNFYGDIVNAAGQKLEYDDIAIGDRIKIELNQLDGKEYITKITHADR